MAKDPKAVEGLKAAVLLENLRQAAAVVCPAAPRRATLPILSHVSVASDRGRLRFEASDLDVAVRYWVGSRVDAEGALTVPAVWLRDVAKRLDDGVATLSASSKVAKRMRYPKGEPPVEEEYTAWRGELATEEVTLSFVPQPPEDFPRSNAKFGPAATFEAKPFLRALARAAACADGSPDCVRPILTGVYLAPHEGRLRAVGADGFRLAIADAGAAPTDCAGWLVPYNAVRQVLRVFGRWDETLQVAVNEPGTVLEVRGTDAEVSCQLIQGTFPNYHQLLPEEVHTTCVVPGRAFARAVALADVVAREGSGIVRLEVSRSGGLVVSAAAEEVGEMRQRLVAAVAGPAARIAFNQFYLREMLASLGSGDVTMSMTTPSSPATFVGADGPDLQLIMPMFVKWDDVPARERGAA